MSSTAAPISPTRFASALADLPLSSLHAKAAELRNSIAHLRSSNQQLQPFAADGDKDCAEAIEENEVVMQRMTERIAILKAEVVGRGMPWVEEVEAEEEAKEGEAANGTNGQQDTGEEGVHL